MEAVCGVDEVGFFFLIDFREFFCSDCSWLPMLEHHLSGEQEFFVPLSLLFMGGCVAKFDEGVFCHFELEVSFY